MRRSDKELPAAEAMEFLAEARDGVLSMVDPSGRPYAVPVNHAVVDGQIVILRSRGHQDRYPTG